MLLLLLLPPVHTGTAVRFDNKGPTVHGVSTLGESEEKENFTTELPRTTLGTGLARTGTNTGKRILAEKEFSTGLSVHIWARAMASWYGHSHFYALVPLPRTRHQYDEFNIPSDRDVLPFRRLR